MVVGVVGIDCISGASNSCFQHFSKSKWNHNGIDGI